MLKKIVSYGLISVMSLSILAACGTSDDDNAEPTVTRAESANAPAIATATAEGEAAAATAKANGETDAETTSEAPAAGGQGGESAAAPAGGPVNLTVTAVDIAFEEKELAGPADIEFTITVTNNGAAQHDFVIDELGIMTKLLNPGESETVTINAPAGDYEYYCSVPGHKAAGMVGTLTLSAGGGAAAAPAGSEAAGGEQAASGPVDLAVSAVDIAFEQKELSGPADTEFTITVTNNGAAQHDFVIDALGVKTKLLNPGESETVTVNAPAGEYEYYCDVPGHKAAGMVGTLTLSAGGGAAAAPAGGEATAQEGAAAAPAGGQAASGPVDLAVSAVDIAFEEKELTGPADTEFTITVTNNGAAQHDFVIDALGVKTKLLNPGESETVTVNGQAGDYEYYCSVPGHKAAGMVGTLTLSADAGAAAAPAGDQAAVPAAAEASPAASPAAAPAAAPAGDQAAAGGATELTVTAVDIAFEEKELSGPADTEFTITVTNNGAAQHDFVIDALGITTKLLNPGESETVTINAPAGEYEYYCSVPGHKAAGMVGTLTIQ